MSDQFDSLFKHNVERLHYSVGAEKADSQGVKVVIWPTFAGLSDFEKSVAAEIAAFGVSATAVDLYGQGRNPIEMDAKSATMGQLLAEPVLLHGLLRELTDAVIGLQPNQKIIHLGFCLGGRLAIEAGLHLKDSHAAVSFHGLMSFYRAQSVEKANTQTKILVFNGYSDPLISDEEAQSAKQYWTALGMDWQFVDFGGTAHSFMLPHANAPERGNVYNPVAASRSYQYLKNFLNEL